jgi:hypothetical protein
MAEGKLIMKMGFFHFNSPLGGSESKHVDERERTTETESIFHLSAKPSSSTMKNVQKLPTQQQRAIALALVE